MAHLNVTLLQPAIAWENAKANRANYTEQLDKMTQPTDVIVLPEMFTTGFTMQPANCAEAMGGESMQWMAKQAEHWQAAVVGSLIIAEENKYFNRLIWMEPGGKYLTYDKRHLFAMGGEDKAYTPGTERLIVSFRGWRICPLICYDLRFPVWSRNEDSYDVLIYVANWPNQRAYDWQTLLRARAIENQCYVVAVNRVGSDNNGHEYNGDSCVIDPGWKAVLWQAEANKVALHTHTLTAEHLQEVRFRLPFLADRDQFRLDA